jgi:hypothetical protein
LPSMKRLNETMRYCVNPDCPHLRIYGKPYCLGRSKLGCYYRAKCGSCKTRYVWNGRAVLEEIGTMVLEDVAICPTMD